MQLNRQNNEDPIAQKRHQKSSAENRKTSGESHVKTSENTPKSERLNIIKIKMDNIMNHQYSKSEEVKSRDHSLTKQDLLMEKFSPRHGDNNENIDWMSRLQETKNQMATTSPAPPIAALLKRESSAGENMFDMQNTPNRPAPNNQPITFAVCKNHFVEMRLDQFISDDESLTDGLNHENEVRDFTLNQFVRDEMSDVESPSKKIHNPFVHELESAEFSFNDCIGKDPIDEVLPAVLTPEKYSKPKKNSKRSKAHEISDKAQLKPVIGVKRFKVDEDLEKTIIKVKTKSVKKKDTLKNKKKARDQKSDNKSTKNSRVGKLKRETSLIKAVSPIESTGLDVSKFSSEQDKLLQMEGSRKSMRLQKRESNLEE